MPEIQRKLESMKCTLGNVQSARSSKWFITLAVSFAVFTDSFMYSAIVPEMPDALSNEGFPEDKVQKLITAMLAVFGVSGFVTSAPWGWYSDQYLERRKPFLVGLAVLLSATVLLWIAPSLKHGAVLPVQILGRALQGFASAIVGTTALAVLVDAVGHGEVGEYAGYIGLAINLGGVCGPLLGGVVYDHGGYHGVFGLVIGVIIIDIILRLTMKERPIRANSKASIHSGVDIEGILKSEDNAVENASDPSSSLRQARLIPKPRSVASRVPAIIRLLGSRRFCVNLWGIIALATVFTGFETVLPSTVEKEFGWGPTGAGLMFLPFSVPSLAGTLFGKLTDRFGGRWFIFASFVAVCPCLILLRFVKENAMAAKVLLGVLLFLIGTGLNISLEPMFAEIARRSTELEEQDKEKGRETRHGYYAQAYAHFNMAWSLGNTIGPVMAGFINDSKGWETTTLALGVLCGFSAIPMVLYSDGWLFDRCRGERQPERENMACGK